MPVFVSDSEAQAWATKCSRPQGTRAVCVSIKECDWHACGSFPLIQKRTCTRVKRENWRKCGETVPVGVAASGTRGSPYLSHNFCVSLKSFPKQKVINTPSMCSDEATVRGGSFRPDGVSGAVTTSQGKGTCRELRLTRASSPASRIQSPAPSRMLAHGLTHDNYTTTSSKPELGKTGAYLVGLPQAHGNQSLALQKGTSWHHTKYLQR